MRIRRMARYLSVLLAFTLVAAGGACSQRDDDDDDTSAGGGDSAASSDIPTEDCVADPTEPVEGDTITLASSYPQSGLTAAFSEIARGWMAYFEMMNDQGGVEFGGETFQIDWVERDDEYNAARTSANIEELVGQDGEGAFAVFSVVGTANNLAIRDFLGELCVPDIFAATGSPAWGNPDYPWLIGSTLPPYTLESQRFAELLEEEQPDAEVAMLLQNDDFGAAYREGLEQAIEGTDITIGDIQEYPTGASEVASQITSLANSGATAFFNGGTLLACPDALSQAAANNWEPITWVSGTCISKTLMGIAGEAGAGVYSASNIKDPLDPQWDDDEAMQEYRDTLAQYQPEADPDNGIVAYGWTQAAILVEAMANAEEPTRLALMESLRNLEVSDVGLLLPGVTVRTGPDDPYMGEQLQLVRYNFQGADARNYFETVGDIADYEGQTADLTPEDLISG
ncbi:MAG TPA: ABC transporter substrate-binding protein [Acidimicrobiales bacterium]